MTLNVAVTTVTIFGAVHESFELFRRDGVCIGGGGRGYIRISNVLL